MSNWKSWKPQRLRPPGDWRQFGMAERVVALWVHRRDVVAFVAGCWRAEQASLSYGVRVVREPENPHDPNALAVFGHWEVRKKRFLLWPKVSAAETRIGYLPANYCAQISRAGPDFPLALELYELALADNAHTVESEFGVVVKVILLIPSARDPVWGPTVKLILS